MNRLAGNRRNDRITQFNRNDFRNQPAPPPSLSNVLIYGNKASLSIDMNGRSIHSANEITANKFIGDISGNITTATNIAGGTGGSIPYQSATNTTTFLSNGTSGQVLTSQGNLLAPHWTTLSTPSLSSVLAAGNKASTTIDMSGNNISNAGALTLKSDNIGYTNSDKALLIQNTNATAGNTTGVPAIEFYKSGRNSAINDIVMSQQFNALDYTGTKRTFGKIECSITGASVGAGVDGALDFYSCVNGSNNIVFRMNGADNENNCFRPLDMVGNPINTSAGDMSITSTASTGNGNITINSKGSIALTSVANDIDLNSNTTIQAQKTLSLSKSASIVSTQILNGESIINSDLTNSNTATLDTNALTFLNGGAGTSTIYNNTGFADITNNSIACNTSNGFRLINGTNTSTHNQSTIEIVNNGTTQDTILLQNTGGGNPVFNLVSSNTGLNQIEQSGMSVNSVGCTRTDTSSGQTQNIQLYYDSASGGRLQYTNNLTANPLIISTDRDLQMDISQDLVFNGLNIQSGFASGDSGQHLRIKLNGVYYKIKLEND